MKNKLTITIIAFLLLVPLRLPISILFINLFEYIISATTSSKIPIGILATNVILSKVVYNIIISILFVINIEYISREKYGRKARTKVTYPTDSYKEEAISWWIVPISMLLLVFIIVDAVSIHTLFYK